MSKFEDWEINKYWEIFSGLNPVGGLLSGDKVSTVLKNSQLSDSDLEKIWDLSDVDSDGNLDFEEFCIAMRLIFDLINGTATKVPDRLPDWLIPGSKAHLVTANNAVSGGSNAASGIPSANDTDYDEDDEVGLSTDFSWYISPGDRDSYTSIYSADADYHGMVSFDALTDLYSTLDNVPDTDIRSAWNLVNPKSNEKIEKDQCIVFLHILNQRSKGFRIPRNVPASLRATFEKAKPEYSLNSKQSIVNRPTARGAGSTSKKSQFAEGYLSRLGLAGRSAGYQTSGTDFSSTKDTDWEEVRLRRELTDLENLIKDAEEASERRKKGIEDFGSSTSALIRRELEQLLDYKEKQLQTLRAAKSSGSSSSTTGAGSSASLKESIEEVDLIAQQVQMLQEHKAQKEKVLADLKAQLASASA
ncbi:End3p [Sugiyamaella lignohabitans]|uniref:Actin cytoskeleton-regulatory complex protein END3 n=1 Tax=Sugiyamaella lignohabitans TaxID=796027 RepID=A0A167DBU4_9ASCO|nr:End3p [Sugiyamaella lignohabitans]ANB12732.1 End3p [Sugiyamaella lignohabitans]